MKRATHRGFRSNEATLNADGSIELDSKRFRSPSSAGHSLRKRATNGWYFWATADGRRLRDLRTELQNAMPADEDLGSPLGWPVDSDARSVVRVPKSSGIDR